ncbi:MAG: DNA primase [Candidatus Blackburnbacteria bacterium]|nr:DNA primase [Candidatus Blackburnbacteria bacterium]
MQLISEHVELKRAGRNFKGICPFHSEKTPSFMVSPELQIFKCFGCGAGGDAYRFLMEFEKLEFPEALKILADRVGVKLEPLRGFPEYQEKEEIYKVNHLLCELYHYVLVSHGLGKTAREYLEKRGIGQEAVKAFQVGFAPDSSDFAFRFLTTKKGYSPTLLERAGIAIRREGRFFDRFRARLTFPLRDHLGNTLGFSARILEARGDLAKYINTPDTQVYKKGRVLYGLDITKSYVKEQGFAVLVEGEFDVISSWQVGVKNIVAIKGSALTQDQARLLSRFCQTLHFALDSDLAGDEAARRGVEIAQKEGLEVKVVKLGKFKDPDEAAQKDPSAWQKAVEAAVGVYDFWLESVFRRFDAMSAEGKGRISKSLAPVLAKIEDEIVRAHYIKQTAQRLGVPEEAVFSQVAKQKELPSWQRKEDSGNVYGKKNP